MTREEAMARRLCAKEKLRSVQVMGANYEHMLKGQGS